MDDQGDEVIMITRRQWTQVQAWYVATNTRMKWLAEQMASMQAGLLHPHNLEARVAFSRSRYHQLLEVLGYAVPLGWQEQEQEDDQDETD